MIYQHFFFFFSEKDTREKKKHRPNVLKMIIFPFMKTHDIKAPDFTRPVFVKLEAWGSLLTVSLESSWHRKTAHLDVKRINEHPRLEIPPRLVCWRCTRHLIPSTGREGVRKSRTSSHGCLSARANGKCGASPASLGGFERVGGDLWSTPSTSALYVRWN